MATHSVNVLIKARDEASRKFGVIGASAAIMGRALKGSASMISTAFRASFEVIKKVAMGIAAAFTYATYAAMKQEDAEISLKGVLVGLGIYTEKLMVDFKQFAAAMQQATTYGDEYVLSLLKVAVAQTDSSEAAKQLVSDTLALLEIVPAGRMKPLAFMKMVLGFQQGGKELDTYLIALKGVTNETRRQEIYQEKLAAAWGIWGEKIHTSRAALIRMWNAVGDVAEVIGGPFLNDITKSAEAVKKWAEDNQALVGLWAEKTHSYVVLIKDVFMSFVDYMREDWQTGIQTVLDIFVKLLETAFYSAIKITMAGMKGIGQALRQNLPRGAYTKKEKRLGLELYAASEEFDPSKHKQLAPGIYELTGGIPKEFYKRARDELKKEEITRPFKDVMKEIGKELKVTFTEILEGLPAELREAIEKKWEEHEKRLAELKLKPVAPGAGGEGGGGGLGGAAAELIRSMSQKLVPRETRLLTFAPGTSFDYERQIAVNTANQLRETREIQKNQRRAANYLELLYREFSRNPDSIKPSNFN